MENISREVSWVARGRFRQAIIRALTKPLTATELCERCSVFYPRPRLSNLWLVLREMEQQELVYRLIPGQCAGNLFFLTERGQAVATMMFGTTVQAISAHFDWRTYAKVARAKRRRLILNELSKDVYRDPTQAKGGNIYRNLRHRHPIAFNPVLDTLKELVRLDLVSYEKMRFNGDYKVYQLTHLGKQIVRQLRKE